MSEFAEKVQNALNHIKLDEIEDGFVAVTESVDRRDVPEVTGVSLMAIVILFAFAATDKELVKIVLREASDLLLKWNRFQAQKGGLN